MMKAEKFIDHLYNSIGMPSCGENDCERCPTAKVIIRECIPAFKKSIEDAKEKVEKASKKHPDKRSEYVKAVNNELIKKFETCIKSKISDCAKVSGSPDNCKKILNKKIQRLNDYKI